VRNNLTLALVLLLAGCGPLVKIGESGPAAQRFTLAATPSDGAPVALPMLRVEEFEAPAELAVNRLAVRVGAQEVRYLAGAVWTDKPARLLRGLISERLRQISTNAIVGPGQLDLSPNWTLSGRLIAFQAKASSGPADAVQVSTELLLLRDAKLIARRRFWAEAAAASDRPADLAAASNRAANQLADEVTSWVIAQAAPAR
jgi:cholesterol transport system auxiliary component